MSNTAHTPPKLGVAHSACALRLFDEEEDAFVWAAVVATTAAVLVVDEHGCLRQALTYPDYLRPYSICCGESNALLTVRDEIDDEWMLRWRII